jgi:peptidyl-prolyl cis-trans isomerase C
MYLRVFCLCIAAHCSFAQTAPKAGAQSDTPAVTPETVVATINGQKFTAREYEQLLANMTPQVREGAIKQPRAVLEQYAMFQIILAEAEQSKLDQQSPYKERIADARRQILVQGQINDKSNSIVVSPDDVKKAYDENRSRYAEAKAKVIFISRVMNSQSLDGTVQEKRDPEESKKLAAGIVAKLKAGADFVKLAKEHSDDASTSDKGADYPDAIRSKSASIPQNIRDAILNANAGDIVGPLDHETGFYIFRVESIDLTPFDQVKNDLYKELKEAGVNKWLEETKKRSTVTINSDAFFAKHPESPRR